MVLSGLKPEQFQTKQKTWLPYQQLNRTMQASQESPGSQAGPDGAMKLESHVGAALTTPRRDSRATAF